MKVRTLKHFHLQAIAYNMFYTEGRALAAQMNSEHSDAAKKMVAEVIAESEFVNRLAIDATNDLLAGIGQEEILQTPKSFTVARKKDAVVISTFATIEEANNAIDRARMQKKAALYIV